MSDAQKAVKLLSQVQLGFIKEETGFDEETIRKMGDQEFSDLYDTLCDIEVDETMKNDDAEPSERERMVKNIVTLLGNELYAQEDEEDE